jgi:hypothetical protein
MPFIWALLIAAGALLIWGTTVMGWIPVAIVAFAALMITYAVNVVARS